MQAPVQNLNVCMVKKQEAVMDALLVLDWLYMAGVALSPDSYKEALCAPGCVNADIQQEACANAAADRSKSHSTCFAVQLTQKASSCVALHLLVFSTLCCILGTPMWLTDPGS